METRIIMTMVVPDDTIYGECRVSVSRWDGAQLVANSQPYAGPIVLAPLEKDQSVFPYAVAALREGADPAIASMIDQMAAHQVLLMHDVELNKTS